MLDGAYEFIETEHRYRESLRRFQGVERVAFDLEGDFDLYRYGKKICLYQFALDTGSPIVFDVLALSNLNDLAAILEDERVEKVIWGAQNDVRALKACHGVSIRNVVDLWEAARVCVTPRPSLPALVRQFCSIEIEKLEELQTSDWNERPLREAQLSYAAQDVRYLISIWDALRELLDQKKAWHGFRQKMSALERLEFSSSEEPWTKIKGSGILTPEQKEKLKTMYVVRDRLARERNSAPWRVVKSEVLLELAKDLPPSEPLDPNFVALLN